MFQLSTSIFQLQILTCPIAYCSCFNLERLLRNIILFLIDLHLNIDSPFYIRVYVAVVVLIVTCCLFCPRSLHTSLHSIRIKALWEVRKHGTYVGPMIEDTEVWRETMRRSCRETSSPKSLHYYKNTLHFVLNVWK